MYRVEALPWKWLVRLFISMNASRSLQPLTSSILRSVPKEDFWNQIKDADDFDDYVPGFDQPNYGAPVPPFVPQPVPMPPAYTGPYPPAGLRSGPPPPGNMMPLPPYPVHNMPPTQMINQGPAPLYFNAAPPPYAIQNFNVAAPAAVTVKKAERKNLVILDKDGNPMVFDTKKSDNQPSAAPSEQSEKDKNPVNAPVSGSGSSAVDAVALKTEVKQTAAIQPPAEIVKPALPMEITGVKESSSAPTVEKETTKDEAKEKTKETEKVTEKEKEDAAGTKKAAVLTLAECDAPRISHNCQRSNVWIYAYTERELMLFAVAVTDKPSDFNPDIDREGLKGRNKSDDARSGRGGNSGGGGNDRRSGGGRNEGGSGMTPQERLRRPVSELNKAYGIGGQHGGRQPGGHSPSLSSREMGGGGDRRRGGRGGDREHKSGGRNGGGRMASSGSNLNLLPAEPLIRSANAWRPAEVTDEVAAKGRKIQGILNKLTVEKYHALSKELLSLGIDSGEEVMRLAVSLLYKKAIDETVFQSMYAQLCVDIAKLQVDVVTESGVTKQKNFRYFLVQECQNKFNNPPVIEKSLEELEAMDVEERMVLESNVRKKFMGNMRFTCELLKKNLVKDTILYACVEGLLNDDPEGGKPLTEQNVEAACTLLKTVGDRLDKDGRLLGSLRALKELATEKHADLICSRVRFLCEEVLEMKANDWQMRREEAGVRSLAEVRRDAEKAARKEKEQTQKLLDRGKVHAGRNRQEQWNTVKGGSSSAGGMHPRGASGDVRNKKTILSKGGNSSSDKHHSSKAESTSITMGKGAQESLANSSQPSDLRPQRSSNAFAVFGVSPPKSAGTTGMENGEGEPADEELQTPTLEDGEMSKASGLGAGDELDNDLPWDDLMAELPERVTNKINTLMDEYLNHLDLGEALLCWKEQDERSHGRILSECLIKIFDAKEKNQRAMQLLWEHLAEQQAVAEGVFELVLSIHLEMVPDFVPDSPKWPVILGEFLGIALKAGWLSIQTMMADANWNLLVESHPTKGAIYAATICGCMCKYVLDSNPQDFATISHMMEVIAFERFCGGAEGVKDLFRTLQLSALLEIPSAKASGSGFNDAISVMLRSGKSVELVAECLDKSTASAPDTMSAYFQQLLEVTVKELVGADEFITENSADHMAKLLQSSPWKEYISLAVARGKELKYWPTVLLNETVRVCQKEKEMAKECTSYRKNIFSFIIRPCNGCLGMAMGKIPLSVSACRESNLDDHYQEES
jgi:translation initiation factor 4G